MLFCFLLSIDCSGSETVSTFQVKHVKGRDIVCDLESYSLFVEIASVNVEDQKMASCSIQESGKGSKRKSVCGEPRPAETTKVW